MDAKPADRKSKRDLRYAESQLRNLNTKIDKLLNKLDEKEQDEAKTPEEECVICVNSKATMETWPCGHRVVCRKCLVRTIQIAVSRRSLPLRCVVCRARVLRLKRSADVGRDEAGPHSHDDSGPQTTAATGGRSHSLPAKLRRNAPAAVAVRSRSMGPSKTAVGGHRRQARRRSAAASWVDTLADHDPGDDDDHDDDQDHDDDDATATTVTVKYRKLNGGSDRRHSNQSKNGLQRILSKFKFWRFLRFRTNKP